MFHFPRGFYGIHIDNIPSVAVTAYSVEYKFFYRRWIPTTAGAAVLVMLEMCQFPCFVSTLWMIPFAHGRLYLGMNAGEFFFWNSCSWFLNNCLCITGIFIWFTTTKNALIRSFLIWFRANKNIVLATTPNGGHLAFFQGLTAGRLW